MLFGLATNDPTTIVLAIALLVLTGLLAEGRNVAIHCRNGLGRGKIIQPILIGEIRQYKSSDQQIQTGSRSNRRQQADDAWSGVSISWLWFVGEQEMKQCVHFRLQSVPATWNQSVSSDTDGTLG